MEKVIKTPIGKGFITNKQFYPGSGAYKRRGLWGGRKRFRAFTVGTKVERVPHTADLLQTLLSLH